MRNKSFAPAAVSIHEAVLDMDLLVHAGVGFVADLEPGDWVALHWDWVCDRLTPRQLRALRHHTASQLDLVNRRVAHSGPQSVLA